MNYFKLSFTLLVVALNGLPAIAAPVSPPSSAKERLQYSLDRGDAAGAVLQVEQAWRSQFETYFGAKLPSQSLDAAAIAQALATLYQETGQKTALIYLLPQPAQLDVILITPGSRPTYRRIQVAKPQLTQAIDEFRSEVSDSRKRRTTSYQASAQQLYQWLIAPIEAELQAQGIDTLIFCAGANLRTVPMAALFDGQRFLVEKYRLALIPAFNLLDRRFSKLQRASILAMGASQFDTQSPLPAVPLELLTIAGSRPQSKFLLNQAFTLQNLKAERNQQPFEIVHLATHAEFQPGSAQQSYIQFWDDRLRLNQLATLGWRQIPVQLLVLSACTTALGDSQAELGFAGLAIQSGAKAAIASLWYVSDVGTLVLMTELYRSLKTAPSKAEALRRAQIAMIRGQARLTTTQQISLRSGNQLPMELGVDADRRLIHPFYWAAFTVIGNPW